ncbi:hypothetical protein PLICRDRAFT_33389 [Plicaturopsis crispa FD-325 SS-3]|nr:hypothetical protein PLICRDRAFT_33389 [Plicaturopsis crispa FD-325 SS-3]
MFRCVGSSIKSASFGRATRHSATFPCHAPRRFVATDALEEPEGQYSVILPKEPFVWGCSHIKPRTVPASIARPPYAINPSPAEETTREEYSGDGRIPLGGDDERRLRAAATLARTVREYARTLAKVGVTTDELDAKVHEYIVSRGAYPSPLLYSGFPRSCCTSVNNIIAHGIPDERPLENGDIVNVDVTVYLDGYHGDTSQTFLIGDVDEPGRVLVQTTQEAVEAAINICGPGRPFRDIGRTIYDIVHKRGFSISPQFTGHGIGTVFHRTPWILHDRNDEPEVMLPGHCFTIEPCVVQGSNPSGWIFPDGWTTSTENCARSAQMEHMVLITETGAEVLTL